MIQRDSHGVSGPLMLSQGTHMYNVQCTCTCTCSVLVEVAKYLVTFFRAGQWLYDSPLDYLQLWLNVSV